MKNETNFAIDLPGRNLSVVEEMYENKQIKKKYLC